MHHSKGNPSKYHTFALFDPLKMGSLMTPVVDIYSSHMLEWNMGKTYSRRFLGPAQGLDHLPAGHPTVNGSEIRRSPVVPWSKVAILGMVIPPL